MSTVPTQTMQLTPKDLQDPSLGALNNLFAQIQAQINSLNGSGGKTVLPSGVDVKGQTVSNVGEPATPTDAISKAHAEANYSAPVIAQQLEAGANVGLKSYRAIGSKSQQEPNSAFLQNIMSVAPTANTSTISSGSPSSGKVAVTISAGQHLFTSGKIVSYAQRTDSLSLPSGSAQSVYYYYLTVNSQSLAISPAFTEDTQQNRVQVNVDGTVLIAVATLGSGGLVTTQSAAGATPPSTTGNSRILARL